MNDPHPAVLTVGRVDTLAEWTLHCNNLTSAAIEPAWLAQALRDIAAQLEERERARAEQARIVPEG